jgi:Fusaric acid resistance protein family
MTYPRSTTGFARAPAQTSPAILGHGINRFTPTPEQHWLSNSRGFTKSATPASDGSIPSAVIFSGKTFAAALLALFISFWLALDEPYWALLTVFVVA